MAQDAGNSSSKYNPVAVAVVHGIGKQLPEFADEFKARLTDLFVNQLPSRSLVSHIGYWSDNNILNPIAQSLARVWQQIN